MRRTPTSVRSALVAFLALAALFLASAGGVLNASDVWDSTTNTVGARLLYGVLLLTFVAGVTSASRSAGKAWAERSSGIGYFAASAIAVHVLTWAAVGVFLGYVSYREEFGGAIFDIWPILVTVLLLSAIAALIAGIVTRLSMNRRILEGETLNI